MSEVAQNRNRNLGAVLNEGIAKLAAAKLETPALDAQILMARVIEKPRTYVLGFPEHLLSPAMGATFLQQIDRRALGTPLAYIVGDKEFWSLALRVNRHTLIPRPETELLVQLALEKLPRDAVCKVADLGTGSGAIALALARERRHWQIIATDRSAEALRVARDNIQQLDVSNIELIEGDWCEPLGSRRFHLIVSNPPYIAAGDPCLKADGVIEEPLMALVSGAEGLDAIRQLASETKTYLLPDAMLMLEHGCDQQQSVRDLLADHGWRDIQQFRDLADLPRVTVARRPKLEQE